MVFLPSMLNVQSQTLFVQDNTSFLNPIIIESITVMSVIQCAFACGLMTKCQGSTFIPDTRICSLVPDFTEKVSTANSMIVMKVEDCDDMPPGGPGGVYKIYPGQSTGIPAFCDGGWTVLQRRFDGSTNFSRNWEEYKHGFGDVTGEYWIGNEIIHSLTSNRNYRMRIDLEAFHGDTAYAEYDVFVVDSEETNYNLTLHGYSGTAGDGMVGSISLNGMMFTTYDRDNDLKKRSNCAVVRFGGWWFENCYKGNMNGLYGPNGTNGKTSIHWRLFKGWYGLKAVSMKIKPTNNFI